MNRLRKNLISRLAGIVIGASAMLTPQKQLASEAEMSLTTNVPVTLYREAGGDAAFQRKNPRTKQTFIDVKLTRMQMFGDSCLTLKILPEDYDNKQNRSQKEINLPPNHKHNPLYIGGSYVWFLHPENITLFPSYQRDFVVPDYTWKKLTPIEENFTAQKTQELLEKAIDKGLKLSSGTFKKFEEFMREVNDQSFRNFLQTKRPNWNVTPNVLFPQRIRGYKTAREIGFFAKNISTNDSPLEIYLQLALGNPNNSTDGFFNWYGVSKPFRMRIDIPGDHKIQNFEKIKDYPIGGIWKGSYRGKNFEWNLGDPEKKEDARDIYLEGKMVSDVELWRCAGMKYQLSARQDEETFTIFTKDRVVRFLNKSEIEKGWHNSFGFDFKGTGKDSFELSQSFGGKTKKMRLRRSGSLEKPVIRAEMQTPVSEPNANEQIRIPIELYTQEGEEFVFDTGKIQPHPNHFHPEVSGIPNISPDFNSINPNDNRPDYAVVFEGEMVTFPQSKLAKGVFNKKLCGAFPKRGAPYQAYQPWKYALEERGGPEQGAYWLKGDVLLFADEKFLQECDRDVRIFFQPIEVAEEFYTSEKADFKPTNIPGTYLARIPGKPEKGGLIPLSRRSNFNRREIPESDIKIMTPSEQRFYREQGLTFTIEKPKRH